MYDARERRKLEVHVARGTRIDRGVTIGRRTRINAPSHLGSCDIGAYCAIGGRLVVRSTDHDMRFLNIQDWAQRRVLKSHVPVAGISKGRVTIGNGVWIGDSVIILPGVQVGDGAVIGAGSVVTRSIPAFGVAVGNPARVIRFRYAPEIVEILASIDWWTWDDDRLQRNIQLFETDMSMIGPESLKSLVEELR